MTKDKKGSVDRWTKGKNEFSGAKISDAQKKNIEKMKKELASKKKGK